MLVITHDKFYMHESKNFNCTPSYSERLFVSRMTTTFLYYKSGVSQFTLRESKASGSLRIIEVSGDKQNKIHSTTRKLVSVARIYVYIHVRTFRNDRAIVCESIWLVIRDSRHVALNRAIADYDRALVKNVTSTFLARSMHDHMGRQRSHAG